MSVENAEPTPTMSGRIVEKLGDFMVAGTETVAQISLGQSLLRLVDRFLWVIEKSAQWSLPVREVNTEENGKTFGKIELVRPLPWVLFLPSLVMLRVLKFGINVGAAILGYPKLEAAGLVKSIQKGRRRLRTIKSNGLKNMRQRKCLRNREDDLNEAKKSLINTMLSTLSALSCLESSRRTPSPPPMRVYIQRNEPDSQSIATPEEQSTTESTSPQVDSKRKYSEIIGLDDSSDQSEEETTKAKLERLAAEDSEIEDQDFNPTKEELMTSQSSSADEDDEDDLLSESEINDLRRACTVSTEVSTSLAVDNKVIVEEPETEPEPKPKVEVIVESSDDKTSTPNEPKITVEKILDNPQPVEETELVEKVMDHKFLIPLPEPETDGENAIKFYSPINSPGDSPGDFKSPINNDTKQPPILVQEKLNKTGDENLTETDAELDNGNLNSSGTSMTSGNFPDGTTTNGTHKEQKRSHATGAGKTHHKGKHAGISHRKKK